MTVLRGKIKNGQVVLDRPAELPDDTEVLVTPGSVVPEDDGPMTPDAITRVLAAMEKVQPFEMTDAERAAWEADRLAAKTRDKAQFVEHAEQLRRMWDDPIPPR